MNLRGGIAGPFFQLVIFIVGFFSVETFATCKQFLVFKKITLQFFLDGVELIKQQLVFLSQPGNGRIGLELIGTPDPAAPTANAPS